MPPDRVPEFQRRETKFEKFIGFIVDGVDKPVTAFREKFVEPIQGKHQSYYYHRRYRRVPTIDECEVGEPICHFEANAQFKRDKEVDNEILKLLRQRRIECEIWYGIDAPKHCQKVTEDYEVSAGNWFSRYGDIGAPGSVKDAYMRQKHRMIFERRHGPLGSGMNGNGGGNGGEVED